MLGRKVHCRGLGRPAACHQITSVATNKACSPKRNTAERENALPAPFAVGRETLLRLPDIRWERQMVAKVPEASASGLRVCKADPEQGDQNPCVAADSLRFMRNSLESRMFCEDQNRGTMRALEIVVALIVAAVAFVAVKLLGLVIHVALIAAVLGLALGFVIARLFRRT